jgi:hypothetical protein
MNWLANSSCIVRMEIIMDLLEIILLIVGIAIIIISCLIVGNQNENTKQRLNANLSLNEIFSEDELKKLKEKITEQITNASEDIINSTDDQFPMRKSWQLANTLIKCWKKLIETMKRWFSSIICLMIRKKI